MFGDLGSVRATLKERLAPALPQGFKRWTIDEYLKAPPTEYRTPLIMFEFTRFDQEAFGQRLAGGAVAAGIDIVLGSPKTGEKGEDDVDELALTLIRILDKQSDIYWSPATKQTFEATGQWVWRIPLTVLTETKEQ
ncbi:hypothetical protein [Microbacterium hydrocarbonoxydans]|uniref:hypothetical protein n=1 Tax=Microbacterium hydrocarbonoxydans TaxID=273678 RepID=UPI00203BB4EB|nr:hypothetical protein [Microbacterium hydrocarbonoxydans]MCM3779865.1 hypothetical protein [Microbacterium hydrocarbonoxydans]